MSVPRKICPKCRASVPADAPACLRAGCDHQFRTRFRGPASLSLETVTVRFYIPRTRKRWVGRVLAVLILLAPLLVWFARRPPSAPGSAVNHPFPNQELHQSTLILPCGHRQRGFIFGGGSYIAICTEGHKWREVGYHTYVPAN